MAFRRRTSPAHGVGMRVWPSVERPEARNAGPGKARKKPAREGGRKRPTSVAHFRELAFLALGFPSVPRLWALHAGPHSRARLRGLAPFAIIPGLRKMRSTLGHTPPPAPQAENAAYWCLPAQLCYEVLAPHI